MTYGLPTGTNIPYGAPGFPAWVYRLADAFGLKASTYPDHQEGDRAEAGYAPNPNRENRGIDWAGTTAQMHRFADYLLTVKSRLEQVIWENPNTGQRVGIAGGDDVTATPYFSQDWAGHRDHVHTRQSQPIPLPGMEAVVRPDFNEYPVWASRKTQQRSGTKVDLFLLHTEEGGSPKGGADRLARWLRDSPNEVSYHYTISQDPDDQGVTVCDVVDTDLAAWSVGNANNRSINLCFAGSRAGWTRAEWMKQSKAIDVAAFLAVQDCRKYGIPTSVLPPPYTNGRAGISDHNYVTRVIGWGTHTDVGLNFPWDYFAERVKHWTAPTDPKPEPPKPSDLEQRLAAVEAKLAKLAQALQ